MRNLEALKDFGCKKINHHLYYGSIHIYRIYRKKLRSDEGSTLAVKINSLEKLLMESKENPVFILFSCLDKAGIKRVGIIKLDEANLETTVGENTSKPFFRSVITGDLIIRIGGYDWSTLSSNLIGYQEYQELYQAC